MSIRQARTRKQSRQQAKPVRDGWVWKEQASNELGELSTESKQGRVKKVEWKIAIELWGPGFDNCKGDYISCMSMGFLNTTFHLPDAIYAIKISNFYVPDAIYILK